MLRWIVSPKTIILASFLAVAALTFDAGTIVTPARADVAQRCDRDGCSYIHCNRTGDRCYRVDDHGRVHGRYDEYYGGRDGYDDRDAYDRDDYDRDDFGDDDRDRDDRHHHHDRDDDDDY